uniref:DUF7627 domain-containing protein n=1 Tax=Romanomermis culicivorax TaxID=13658 RepID=A0A915J8L9_ROMCU
MRERLLASYVLINEWCKSVKSSSDSYRFNGKSQSFDGHILSNSTNSFKPLRESNSSPSEKYTFRTRYSRYFNNSGKELQEFTGNRRACSAIINSIEIFIDDDSSETLTVEGKWKIILDVVLKHVMLEPYVYLDFTVSTFAHFLHDKSFQNAVTRRLEREIAECMLLTLTDEENNGEVDQLCYEDMDDRSKVKNFCQLISRLLITSWPSQHKGFSRQRNALTYVGITAVHTWLDCIEKTTKNKSEDENDFEALKICSYSLIQLLKNTGRKLWLSWPDLVDRIYSVIKLVIISNDRLVSERIKERLLSTYVQINDFPKSTKCSVKTRHAYTQTYQSRCEFCLFVLTVPQKMEWDLRCLILPIFRKCYPKRVTTGMDHLPITKIDTLDRPVRIITEDMETDIPTRPNRLTLMFLLAIVSYGYFFNTE